jgi:hypothetical protein
VTVQLLRAAPCTVIFNSRNVDGLSVRQRDEVITRDAIGDLGLAAGGSVVVLVRSTEGLLALA